MLIYHPMNDIYHGCFRILQILESIPEHKCELDRLRILDFYLLFPSQLLDVSFPKSALPLKNKLKKFQNTYEQIEDAYKLFIKLKPFQELSLSCLVSVGLICYEENGYVSRSQNKIPDEVRKEIQIANKEKDEIIKILNGPFFSMDFYGEKGLKARTGLMEYRYDNNK